MANGVGGVGCEAGKLEGVEQDKKIVIHETWIAEEGRGSSVMVVGYEKRLSKVWRVQVMRRKSSAGWDAKRKTWKGCGGMYI